MLAQGLVGELSQADPPGNATSIGTQAHCSAYGGWEENKRRVAKHSSHRTTIHPDPATI